MQSLIKGYGREKKVGIHWTRQKSKLIASVANAGYLQFYGTLYRQPYSPCDVVHPVKRLLVFRTSRAGLNYRTITI
jgi:hypothetical protein